ncbi:MAG: hypothetical protein ABSG53_02780 [Thermoguttaceae bacterium]
MLLLFVVLGSSLAVFGAWGSVVFGLVVALAVYLHHTKSLSLLSFHVLLVCNLMLFIVVLVTVNDDFRHDRPNWTNVAALAVWLLSVGMLLVGALRSHVGERVPIVRTRPSKSAVCMAYACELLLIIAMFFFPCTCGYLARWALWVTVPCMLSGWYAVLHVERSMLAWRNFAGVLAILASLVLAKNIADALWYGHDAVFPRRSIPSQSVNQIP